MLKLDGGLVDADSRSYNRPPYFLLVLEEKLIPSPRVVPEKKE